MPLNNNISRLKQREIVRDSAGWFGTKSSNLFSNSWLPASSQTAYDVSDIDEGDFGVQTRLKNDIFCYTLRLT